MKTYIYQDEKSHKFWAVEQQGNELHISWGKVSTNGQSQVKSFADTAAAEKAELKLIAEKVKKGYVGQVDSNANSHDASAKKVIVIAEKASINHQASTNGSPWLADNDPIILPPNIARYALSHRLWPGETVKKPTKPEKQNLISRLANRTYHYYKNLTFDYSSCSDEWADAISQAISLIKAQKTEIPARTMAVLTLLEICFCQDWNGETSSELLDEIVSTFGIEYATETVIFWWQIDFDFDYKNEHLTLFINHADYSRDSYRRNRDKFSFRLRKHLSLAEKEVWNNCIAKLLVALPDISVYRQPLIAILMPEIPEVAHEIVQRLHQLADIPQLEMLKLVATDPITLEILENYQHIDVFNTYGTSWSATVLQEQGITALARLVPYAQHDSCGDVLTWVNHPQAVSALIEATDNNKRCYERLIKSAENFPSATIAALAEALVKKDDKRKHTLLVSLLNANPLLAEKLVMRLSPHAADLVQQCQQLLNSRNEDFANSEMLPVILVSPPWATTNKNNDNSPVGKYLMKIPALPLFYQPSLWTRPKLKNSSKVLPDNALLHLGEMLRFPLEEELYPGLLQVKDACTTDSLAEFAWDLFTAWQTAGTPSKESWAFTALGVLGNDDTARKLTPLIRAWPGESQHKRA
ncbi:WGR domain-containing protein, partial [Escherichia coli]|nr:WGR domain-containing protein [Escherichia coli]